MLTGRSAGSSSILPAPALSVQKFCAPPPSAASLSTYGVVKPAGMKMQVDGRHGGTSLRKSRRRTRVRNPNSTFCASRSPPPSYSQPVVNHALAGLSVVWWEAAGNRTLVSAHAKRGLYH
ncbi:unnamed protein product [Toxocara canis]|uniref:Secreted protein n=1 Tax=Toxocara canis TaxID=6265 RepID=A0A183VCU9_TOXCA|nr:unnamed protein product [Toxocara canis]